MPHEEEKNDWEKYVGFGVRERVQMNAWWRWPKDYYHDLPLTTLQFRTPHLNLRLQDPT